MAELTAVEIQAKIDAINVQLEQFVAGTQQGVDVSALDVSVKNNQRIQSLQDERNYWVKQLSEIPTTEVFYYRE